MHTTQWKKTAVILTTAFLLAAPVKAIMAGEHNHHSHGPEKQAQLSLNNGKKWVTDENLRQAMAHIRDGLEADLHAIHAGKATSEQYRALAQKTHDQVAFITKNCKLEQKTDAMFHIVLADIVSGADAMAGQDGKAARKGAEKIARALENYGAYFDHSGWQGAKHSH
ncbi:MAG: hypothetical protein OEV35_00150 [Gallionellaceae bacterium]|nr:hypothetical protein [Gallionellaceae bacterium]